MFKILQTCLTLWPVHVRIILHANAKLWVFADRFCSHFNARGFTNRCKSWIQFRSNNVHYHFCFLSPKSCFKSATVVKTYLKAIGAPDLHVFAAVVGLKKTFTRKFWGLCTHWSSILKPPKHWNVFLLSILKSVWKQDLGSFQIWPANAPLEGENMQKAHKPTNQLWWSR